MQSLLTGALLLILSPVSPVSVRAQTATPTEQPRSEFFSGTITALSDDKITVFKSVLGKNSERTFLIDQKTRVEGKLRVKARVTVRYSAAEDGDHALHIIVRTSQRK
ncbi:MAG TPA: DUF5666 domain-containing protein [Bryobacteraceae bacterium]|nr:DUF5666 domain-containing protein [Bryobacteraceae bacterium]